MPLSDLMSKLNERVEAQDDLPVYEESQYDGSEMQSDELLQIFEDSMMDKLTYKVAFDFYDGTSWLIHYDSDADITFKVALAELIPAAWGEADVNRGANWLNRDITVSVKAVDHEDRTVIFNAVQEISERSQIYNEIYNKIDRVTNLIRPGEEIRGIKGTVYRVYPNRITVNLLQIGVLGILYIPDWQQDYTLNLEDSVKVGETYTFDITGMRRLPHVRTRVFVLDHKPYTRSAWDKLKRYPIGAETTLSLRCVRVNLDDASWYAVSANGKTLPDGMVVRGNYKRGEGGFVPEVGQIVQARIVVYEPENHRIRIQAYRPDSRNAYYRAPEETKKEERK